MSGLRLTPLVAGAWAAAAAGLAQQGRLLALLALVVVMCARRWPSAALAGALVIAGSGGIAWARASAAESGELQVMARERSVVELAVTLRSGARQRSGVFGAYWSARGVVDGWTSSRGPAGGGQVVNVVVRGAAPKVSDGDRLLGRARLEVADDVGAVPTAAWQGTPEVVAATDLISRLRAGIVTRLLDVAPRDSPEAAALIAGMAVGADESLPESSADVLQRAGLSHLTAVSGANLALVFACPMWVLGWFKVGRRRRLAFAGLVVLGYVVIVGYEPSVVRAAVMMGAALAAWWLGGAPAAGHGLQVAVLLLLLADPWLAVRPGFALSVAATAALVLVVGSRAGRPAVLRAAVAAQVATLPLLVAMGAPAGPSAVLANVLAFPAVPVVTLGGVVAAFGGPLRIVQPVPVAGADYILWVARGSDRLPQLPWPGGPAGVAGATLLALLVVLVVVARGEQWLLWLGLGGLVGIPLLFAAADGWPPPGWVMVVCDVGQGDAVVVRAGDSFVLVDTGPDPQPVDRCLRRLGVDRIDLLVLTHFHADHVGGLPGALDGREVGQVWVSPLGEPAEEAAVAGRALARVPAPVVVPQPGQALLGGGTRITALWPGAPVHAGSAPNNSSLCLMVRTPGLRMLLLGDAEVESQAAIVRRWPDLAADVVKVPHHGSANFDESLPARVGADTAVISVGAGNSYGHPAAEAVAAWQGGGARVFTTMDNGDVAVLEDGRVAASGAVP